MPMNRSKYPENWEEISLARRTAANWQCEWCGRKQGQEVIGVKGKPYKVVLTVAHLGVSFPDGTPGDKHNKHDVRPDNLAALCNSCHLRYDHADHIQHAKETRERKNKEAAMYSGQLAIEFDEETQRDDRTL